MDAKVVARFWSCVERKGPTECWEWQLGKSDWGYGRFYPGKLKFLAHKFAYEVTKGPVPSGLYVLHSCDNRLCCNPAHLRAGTHLDNMRDMTDRGRARGPSRNPSARKLSAEQVERIRCAQGKTNLQLSKLYGVSENVISQIRRGKTYRDLL